MMYEILKTIHTHLQQKEINLCIEVICKEKTKYYIIKRKNRKKAEKKITIKN